MATNFETFGPFLLSRDGNYVAHDTLLDFWEVIAEKGKHQGLEDAIGVYIVSVRHGKSASKPWYVGKTNRGFRRRLKSHAAGLKLFAGLADAAPKGKVEIFFIARMSASGKKFKSPNRSNRSIDRLEERLIGTCLSKNKRLLNIQKMGRYRDLHVPGFTKEHDRPNRAASALRKMLG